MSYVKPTPLGGSTRPTSSYTAPQSQPNTSQLPESLTKFATLCSQRASQMNFTEDQKAVMNLQLRQLMTKAIETGKLFENDWGRQKIPVLDKGVALELFCNLGPKKKNDYKKNSNNNPNNNSNKRGNPEEDEMSSEDRKRHRAQRFERELNHTPVVQTNLNNENEYRASRNQQIRGTCQVLEKSYLRLTSAPDPNKVRPLPILQRAFTLIFDKYKQGAKYSYVCDQFKSMRQDLRVQFIENEFTVKVYETHARIAIENKDLGEFNQCQTVLKNLYQSPQINSSANKSEFLSYRILYHLLTRDYDSITLIKLKLQPHEKNHPLIKQSIDILKAQVSDNYYELFKLYAKTKGTTRQLMDCFINNERIRALAIICSSYKILSLEFLLGEFHFSSESDCMKFITERKIDKFIELRGENVYLNTGNARTTVNSFLSESRKVDIKGQI